jgi:uncharacterized iron-regulated membrane protein
MQNKSVRQSMAWLHAWTGLIFGWLLFAIFLMGTSAYYRHQINLWMQPQLSQYQINQVTAIQTATEYLEKMQLMLNLGISKLRTKKNLSIKFIGKKA